MHGLRSAFEEDSSFPKKRQRPARRKQKTFIPGSCGKIPAMASIVGASEEQKSFGSFLVTAQVGGVQRSY
jgi:hypothetical protein